MAAGDHGRRRLRPGLVSGASRQLEPKQPEDPPKGVSKDVARGGRAEDLPHLDRDAQRGLPPGMAELIVFPLEPGPGGKPSFGLRGVCCCSDRSRELYDPGRPPGRPEIDSGRAFGKGGLRPDTLVLRMMGWSNEQRMLTGWLDERRHDHDKLELMIWDDTASRLPWELLPLSADSAGVRPVVDFLGAAVTVTRWATLDVTAGNRDRVRTWLNPYRASGPVTAYIHDRMSDDKALFDGLDPELAEDMWDLLEMLKRTTAPDALAMVYVGCHAEFGDDPDHWVLGGLRHALALVFHDDLIRLRMQDTLVFLNGCNTGSIGDDMGVYNDGALRGFAKVFLQAGAAGVLATTSQVLMGEAGVVARRLLDHLKEHPELHVADAVRELRAEAAQEIKDNMWRLFRTDRPEEQPKVNMELYKLLHPFLYVYFGSPRMQLSLARRDVRADASGPVGAAGQP
jgi:hypothetical protein